LNNVYFRQIRISVNEGKPLMLGIRFDAMFLIFNFHLLTDVIHIFSCRLAHICKI
jgi:hypothetical protein